MALTTDKLLLPETEISQLQTGLANAGYPDAIPTKIMEAEATVARYTAAYTLETADKDRLARPIVIYELYALIGAASDVLEKSKNAAMKELEDIRDGKFKGLTDAAGETTHNTGGWGSRTKLSFPGDS